VARWGLELDTQASTEGDTVWLALDGPDAGLLTDDDGKVLEALQYLMSKMSSRVLADNVRVLLDAGGFRRRRDEELRAMAMDAAQRAKERNRPVRLEPLNAYERRVVHLSLQEEPGVRTYSLGRGYFKRVTVEPTEGTPPGQQRAAGDEDEAESSGDHEEE
jgi:spoIIIJ-associated protein